MQESATMINRERFMVHRKAKRISRNTVAMNDTAARYIIPQSKMKSQSTRWSGKNYRKTRLRTLPIKNDTNYNKMSRDCLVWNAIRTMVSDTLIKDNQLMTTIIAVGTGENIKDSLFRFVEGWSHNESVFHHARLHSFSSFFLSFREIPPLA